ncbi:MAG TPA: glycosyltransferase family 4 protein [Geminicoccus sp.]|uniref:glycosyltransferase family 4 protein n=1 Tax=Geminicoccus sp. TaxID=2024832 RepID=UPI002B7B77AF|nr:glycosyltransferase family 4 protein [Geminicoccus sp.]HWL68316.1 glycosyltransferase family 4 protein [Geminicoccus sp.]
MQHRKMLIVCHEYPPIGGGGATAVRILAEEQVRMGREVTVLTSGMRDLPARERQAGVEIVRTSCRRSARHYSTAAELATWIPGALLEGRRLLRARRFDAIHAHFIVPGAMVAVPLARGFGIPLTLTAHGSDVPGYNPDRFDMIHRLIRPLWRYLVNSADKVTLPSAHLSSLLRQAGGPNAVLVPNPFAPQPGIPTRAKVPHRILVATRLVPRKGVQDLIAAVAGMTEPVELIVAGDGPHAPQLRQQAEELNCPVDFRGFLPRETLAELYASSAIFVLPSSHENFPMVLLEAMGAGCAVVTTTAPGCREVVGEAGICVPAGDVEALRAQLVRLVRDPALAREYGQRGEQRVTQFAPDLVAEAFDRVYGSSAENGSNRTPWFGSSPRPHTGVH